MTPQAVLPALTLAQWFICKANLRWKAKCSEQAVPFSLVNIFWAKFDQPQNFSQTQEEKALGF